MSEGQKNRAEQGAGVGGAIFGFFEAFFSMVGNAIVEAGKGAVGLLGGITANDFKKK